MSPSTITRTVCHSAAFGALLLTAASVSAQPTLQFEDSQSLTPGVYIAGDTFNLDLIFSFADGDLEQRPGLRSGGVTFDLTFANGNGSEAGSPLTLGARDFSESPFENAAAMGPFDLTSTVAAPPAGRDLGAFTFSFAPDAGAGPGVTNIGIYSFSSAIGLATGSYRIDFAGDVSTTDTSFDPQSTAVVGSPYTFQIVAIPEPTSLALLISGAGLALVRRRR